MRSQILLIFIFAIAGCNTKTAVVKSGSVNAQAPFLWESAFPKQIYVSDAFSDPDEVTKIDETLGAWETALNGKNFFEHAGPDTKDIDAIAGATNSLRDNKFSIYKAEVWPYPDYPYALAITQIFAIRHNSGDSDEFVAIQEADILLNYDNFLFDAGVGYYDYDFKTVLLHELGHFLGLQHKPDTYNRNHTVMYPSIYSDESKQIPLTVDKQDLAAKYNITLPLTAGGSSIVAPAKTYKKDAGDAGEPVKIILELRANGECLHHVDGVLSTRHQTR